MSNTYAKFYTIPVEKGTYGTPSDMDVTAYMGGNHGKCIQLTMREDYVSLSENQVKELIKVLQARIDGTVTSTGSEEMGDYYPEYVEKKIQECYTKEKESQS